MIPTLLKLAAISCLSGGYYIANYNQISFTNPALTKLFQMTHQFNPQYSKVLFKVMIRLGFLERNVVFEKYILKSGFDLQGSLIEEIRELGFKGLQIGPTTFNASLQEDSEQTLGIKNALANILTYQENNKQSQFLLQLNIAPNLQILKFTPYLLQQNIQHALAEFLDIQQHLDHNITHQINIDFHRKDYTIQATNTNTSQLEDILIKMKKEIAKPIQEFNKNRLHKVAISFKREDKDYLQWQDMLSLIRGEKIIL